MMTFMVLKLFWNSLWTALYYKQTCVLCNKETTLNSSYIKYTNAPKNYVFKVTWAQSVVLDFAHDLFGFNEITMKLTKTFQFIFSYNMIKFYCTEEVD